VLPHLIVGLALVAVGVMVTLLRRRIAEAIRRRGRRSEVLTNPLYYLAVGPAVLLVGLIFAVSALAGYYR